MHQGAPAEVTGGLFCFLELRFIVLVKHKQDIANLFCSGTLAYIAMTLYTTWGIGPQREELIGFVTWGPRAVDMDALDWID